MGTFTTGEFYFAVGIVSVWLALIVLGALTFRRPILSVGMKKGSVVGSRHARAKRAVVLSGGGAEP